MGKNRKKMTQGRENSSSPKFFPTDEELVVNHLKKKVMDIADNTPMIQEVDFYGLSPWNLFEQYPEEAKRATMHAFAYFYSRPYRGKGSKERDVGDGYWLLYQKGLDIVVTGSDNQPTGAVRRTMFFYKRGPGEDEMTKWAVQEYRLVEGNNGNAVGDWIVCRLWELDRHFTLRRTGQSQPYEDRILSL